ncbi:MAG: phosphatase PAP2 family protein [Clostridia bacterium]|nr:phosphatase PAP2 family protein [Clostridia bacterium]
MEVLYFLESIRNPVLDFLMSALTHFGEETLFLVAVMIFLWCVNKKDGYFLLLAGIFGTQINQLLKITFRIERPWVRDPEFTVVGDAKASAGGYSFPSGHTQSAVTTFGGIARITKRAWLRVAGIAICLIVPITRMYLGVHTPADVLTSLVLATAMVLLFYPLMNKIWETKNGVRYLLWALLGWSILHSLFMKFFPFPADTAAAEIAGALKNSYKLLGATAGFYCAYEMDRKWLHFEVQAVWWAQILKVAGGLILTVAVQELGYLIVGLFTDALFGRAIIYFAMALAAAGLWPITFKWFAKLGK